MLKHFAYIIAGMFENAANMIYDAIDMNPHAEPELYISRECLEEMAIISAEQHYRQALLGSMQAEQGSVH